MLTVTSLRTSTSSSFHNHPHSQLSIVTNCKSNAKISAALVGSPPTSILPQSYPSYFSNNHYLASSPYPSSTITTNTIGSLISNSNLISSSYLYPVYKSHSLKIISLKNSIGNDISFFSPIKRPLSPQRLGSIVFSRTHSPIAATTTALKITTSSDNMIITANPEPTIPMIILSQSTNIPTIYNPEVTSDVEPMASNITSNILTSSPLSANLLIMKDQFLETDITQEMVSEIRSTIKTHDSSSLSECSICNSSRNASPSNSRPSSPTFEKVANSVFDTIEGNVTVPTINTDVKCKKCSRISFNKNLIRVCLFEAIESPLKIQTSPMFLVDTTGQVQKDHSRSSPFHNDEEIIINATTNEYDFRSQSMNSFDSLELMMPKSWNLVRNSSLLHSFSFTAVNMISLENIQLNAQIVEGNVAIKNLAFEKNVSIRYTTDNWVTIKETPLQFHSIISHSFTDYIGIDRFKFELNLDEIFSKNDHATLAKIEFVLRYQVEGNEYWDNNDSMNHWLEFELKEMDLNVLSNLVTRYPGNLWNNGNANEEEENLERLNQF